MTNKIKKHLALFLAITLLIPNISKSNVLAAEENAVLTPIFSKTLVFGKSNPAPVETFIATQPDQVFTSWDFSVFDQGVFKLTHFISNGKKVILSIKKEGTIATVKYDVYEYKKQDPLDPNSLWDWSPIVPKSTATTGAGFFVHTDNGANGGERYIDASIYSPFNVNDGFAVVDPATIVAPEVPDTAKFVISRDTGFSFKYDNATIHFRWNAGRAGAADQFFYVTNRMNQGSIYQYELKTIPSGVPEVTAFADKKKIFTGISTATNDFKVEPYASGNRKVADFQEQTTGAVTDPPNQDPGTPDVGMFIEFALPKEYASPNWTGPLTHEVPRTYAMPANFIMSTAAGSNKEIQFSIDNIVALSPSPQISSISPINGPNVAFDSFSSNNEKVKFKLSNLEAGILYNPVRISIEAGEVVSNDTSVPLGRVFTFPKYEVVSEAGKFHVLVTPYAGFTKGYYMLKTSITGSGLLNGLGENSYLEESDGITPIKMPISINAENQQDRYYQVFFSPEQPFVNNSVVGKVYSQILHYKAVAANLSVGVPTNFRVLTAPAAKAYKLLPRAENFGDIDKYSEEADLNMFLQWDIGNKDTIDKLLAANNGKLVITYDIAKTLSPEEKDPTVFTTVQVDITSGSALDVKYSVVSGDGKVVNTENQTLLLMSIPDEEGQYRYVAEVNLEVYAKHKDLIGTTAHFEYPGIYYLNVRPMKFGDSDKNLRDVTISPSLYDSITLSDISKTEVPPPQNLVIDNIVTTSRSLGYPKDEVSFDLGWNIPGAKIKEFVEQSYPFGKDKINIQTNLYISQDERLMREDFYKLDDDLARKNASVKAEFVPSSDNTIYLSQINGNVPLSVDASYTDPRGALRANKVAAIGSILLPSEQVASTLTTGASINLKYKIDGLDKNQKYYVYADIVVTHDGNIDPKSSKLSELVGVTTINDKALPDGVDKVPPSPVLSKDNISLSEATIFWDKIPLITADEKIEYEIIRLKDQQMDANYLETREIFSNVWSNMLPEVDKLGLRTDEDVTHLFTGSEFATEAADDTKYVYDPSTNTIKLTDKTLSPNQLYFYYVRTVRIVDGVEVYSGWSNTSVTTTPVSSPKNLKQETDEEYEPKTEVVISFDAPISDISSVGAGFDLQYQLKPDGEDWGDNVTMDPEKLKASAVDLGSKDKGYYHFTHKITGLKTGTMYYIRVRMVDANGDASIYTNVISIRTDTEQDDYDKNKEIQDWLDNLLLELNELVKEPYWVSRDSSGEFEAIYRPTMFGTVLNEAIGGSVTLAETNANKATYYLPASAVLEANNQKKGFKLKNGDMEIILSPNTINQDENESVFALAQSLKTENISDYYIRLTTDWSETTTAVDGNTPIGKRVDISLETVGSSITSVALDSEIIEMLLKGILDTGSNESLKTKVENMVESGTTDEELVLFILDQVKKLKNEYADKIHSRLYNTLKSSYDVEFFDAPMIIIQKGIEQGTIAAAYELQASTWIVKETVPFGDDKAVYVYSPGSYIFVGRVINIPGINNLPNSGNMVGIVGKYSLDEFLGKDGIDMNENATRYMVVASLARMSGAPRGSEPFKWLRDNRNMSLSSGGQQRDITTEEAIYMVMHLYEVKTNTRMATLKIRNHNATANITGLGDQYKPYVKAAFELGLYKNKNMQPKSAFTIKELLEILGELDVKAKL